LKDVAVVELKEAAARVEPEKISRLQVARVERRLNAGQAHAAVALGHEHQKEKEKIREHDDRETATERRRE
jgi:hypothetical protein